MSNTVVVKGFGVYREANAAEGITPGMLVKTNGSGLAIKNTDVAEKVSVTVAKENDIFGKGINQAYVADDRVIMEVLTAGCEFMGLVAAAAAAIVVGDRLKAVTGGFVGKIGAGEEELTIGFARTAIDNSGGGSPARVRVEVV